MRCFSHARGALVALAFICLTQTVASAQPAPEATPAAPTSSGPTGEPPSDSPVGATPVADAEEQPGQGERGEQGSVTPSGDQVPTEGAPPGVVPEHAPEAEQPPPSPEAAGAAPTLPPAPAEPLPPASSVSAPPTSASAPAPAPGNQASSAPEAWSWATPAAGDPTADQRPETKDDDKVKARVRWRGTAFVWSHDVTTSALGVGSDYQSTSHQAYTQGYGLTLNYYVVDTDDLRLRVAVTPGVDVELTDSGTTTTRREPVIRDLPITAVAIAPLYKKEGSLFATSVLGNFTVIVPTSKYTRGQGDLLTLSPRFLLLQSLPLAGKGASFLESVLIGGGVRYDALFTEANVGVSEGVQDIPRQPTTRRDPESSFSSTDVLSGARVAPHSFRFSGFAMLFEEVLSIPINFAVGANYTTARLANNGDSRIELPTGEIEVDSRGRQTRPSAGWSAGLTLFPVAELGVSLGYSNNADLDSETPNFFYTPSATFSASLAISIDAIYEGLTGPRREVPFILF